MSLTLVFVRMAKELFRVGPRQLQTDILHVSNPNAYAHVPEATSAEAGMLCQELVARETLSSTYPDNFEIETILPTNDEDEIKYWKLVPCSARLQYANSWVRFRCKLLEYKGYPEVCVVVAKSDNVIDCTIYRMADDENDNRLLWVKMKAWRFGARAEVELCCKRKTGRRDSIKASLLDAVSYGPHIANVSAEGDISLFDELYFKHHRPTAHSFWCETNVRLG